MAAASAASLAHPFTSLKRRRPEEHRSCLRTRAASPDAGAAETAAPIANLSGGGGNAGVEVAVPESEEAALRDAVAALRAIAPSLGGPTGSLAASGKRVARAKKGGGARGFGGGGGGGAASSDGGPSSSSSSSSRNRYAIELPVADTSARATIALAEGVLARLAPAGGAVLVYADEGAASAAAAVAAQASISLRRAVLSLRAACRAASLPSASVLILVAPAVADVALVEQLLDEVWAPPSPSSSSASSSSPPPPVVVINPGWAERGGAGVLPREYERLGDSFAVAYSFCPVAISGLVRGKQGAVLLNRGDKTGGGGGGGNGGGTAAAAWRILCETNVEGRFVQIGQARTRPSDDDIQAAFLNASAAASPLTKAVKAARGVFVFGGGKRE